MTLLPDFLEGAVDLHVHSAPDVDERRFDDIELAREAARSGMDAILIKSHQNSTVERAFLVSRMVPDVSSADTRPGSRRLGRSEVLGARRRPPFW
jgi:Family of unknown function (DUF6282)